MTRRLSALLLAMTMVFQLVAPQASFAKQGTKKTNGSGAKIAQQDKKKYRKIGVINGNSYDGKIMNALNREAAKNRKTQKVTPGIRLFSAGPYFGDNNEPKDADKPKYYGNINVDFNLAGLDGNPFQWKEIFGVDEKGNPKPAQIIFTQSDDETGNETGIEYILKVTKTGQYTWSDKNGHPTKLPLFSKALKPYSYEARVDEDVAENIKLLTARMTGTEGASPTFLPENADGEIIANITLDLGLQQVASTKFKSEWKTGVKEGNRPQIKGTIAEKVADLYDHPVVFDLPKNNKDTKIIRDWEDAFEDGLMVADALYKTPTVKLVETKANGLTFDTANKTVTSGDHKYKYDFTYDVINGGKLTMTEVIPVTFDANGGEFASITEENAEQKIVKEVEYGKEFKKEVEEPSKDRETFKGWSETKDGTPLSKEKFEEATKNIIKSKTFYAIWENNEITANPLEVKESFKDDTGYVNNFIPDLSKLKGQVKIKDSNGVPQALANEDTFEILNDSETAVTGDALKDYLYGKLQEKDNPKDEPTRVETVKAKVTVNGRSKIVEIPIKVIKNIYEAKTEEGKPNYVPEGYVKVTVDPTTKAEKPQKYFYYVNPNAQVVIPKKEDPKGTDNNQFTKWLIDGTDTEYKLADKPRYKFSSETTIKAQYVTNVIPQEGEDKPANVPTNFVLVEFKEGAKGSLTGTTKYWVNPTAGKKLEDLKHPTVTAQEGWKHNGWDKKDSTEINAALDVTAQYLEKVVTEQPATENQDKYVKVEFTQGKHGTIANTEKTAYWVLKDEAVTLTPPKVTANENYVQKTGDEAWSPNVATSYKADTEHMAQYSYIGKDVVPAKDDGNRPDNVPDNFVKVTFVPTDSATDKTEKIFWVAPNKEVTIPVKKPVGEEVPVSATNPKAFKWVFTKWTSDEAATRTWKNNVDDGITGSFSEETKITADYDKKVSDQGTVVAKETTVHESFKDGETWVNNFIPTEDALKKLVQVKGSDGNVKDLTQDDKVELVLGDKSATEKYASLDEELYDKLKEKDNPDGKPTRVEKVKARVTFKNGEVQTVDIPIKVVKNIYEVKTLTKKPYYVPDGYKKVTLDPTKKATDSQKTYYYVNPDAKVVISGTDPVGTGDNKFVKWTNGTETEYKLSEKPRHQFKDTTTITAQYVSDVIPQDGPNKPDTVPQNYVEVKFVATGNATDATKADQIFWVNPAKEVTIPVKNPVGKQYFTFKEWKIGDVQTGETYTVGKAKKFENATTITATYDEAKNIIPYDPTNYNDPNIVRLNGYVRVTFEAETGLKLTENKAYYVKKNAGIKLGNTELAKPKYKEQTGYTFKEWDKADDTTIEATDIVVTAKPTKLETVIPEKTGETTNDKPEGYKVVTFAVKPEDAAKGSLEGVTKFYVNPKEYVTITPPKTTANTGYEFGPWTLDATQARVYDKDTTIYANFNGFADIIPKIHDQVKKPGGYKTVTFKVNEDQGSIVGGETTVYYVNPDKAVTINTPSANPKIGYRNISWDSKTWEPRKYKEDTTVTASFEKIDDILTGNNIKPKGYVTVTFQKGDEGKKIDPNRVFYVNPEAGKTMGDINPWPSVTPKIGYKFVKWSINSKRHQIKRDTESIASYEPYEDVIPEKGLTGTPNTKPDGYVTVTFVAGDHGTISGQTVYYVNPEKGIALDKLAPNVTPKTGYESADWDRPIKEKIQYEKDTTITALYNDPGNISKKEVAGYVKVIFKEGASGKLEGTTEYWIKPGVKVNIPAPTANPNVGYKFDKWDKDLTVNLNANAPTYEVTAQYKPLGDVIPQEKSGGSDKPSGYVAVTFKAVNGSLSGTTTYYVNGEKEVDLTNTAKAITKNANVGYTSDGGTWDPKVDSKKYTADAEYTFKFKPLDDVIESKTGVTKPDGYVTVKLIPTNKANDSTEKIYFVNPTKEVTILSTDPVGKKVTDANGNTYTFTFKNWTVTSGKITPSWNKPNTGNTEIKGTFTQDTDITAKYNVKAEKIVNGPLAKDGVMTPEGSKVPEAKDLIKNPYDPKASDNKDNLPEGTTFKYTNDGEPDLSKPGKSTAKVEVKYLNGKTVVVEVPITVIKNVVPQTGTDKPTVPDNYKKVEFVIDPATGGKIADNETKIYYVNPNQKVTIPQPKTVAETGYSFNGWDKDTTKDATYTTNTIVKGSFKKGNDIIPQEKTDGSDKPVGYVTVTFDKGEHGTKIEGQTAFYVNPKANPAKTLGEIAKPTVTPDTGFTFAGWDKEDTTEIKTDITVTARYQSKNGVVPKTRDDDSEKPEGYITVTFDTTDKGGSVTKVVFVNPNKPVVLKGYEPQGFEVKKGYSFAGWDTSINQAIQYQNGTIIKAVYNDPWRISTTEVQGYAKVEFNSGDHGKLIGVTDYWVKPGEDVYLPAPAVEPNTDYRFAGWNKSLTVNLKEGDPTYVITATYAKIEKPKDPEHIVETRVIEVPVRDRNYRKEVWYMCGFGGDFRPHDGLKRSEAAQILANALREDGYKYDPNYLIAYKDVGKNWYAEAVRITTQANVFVGYPDGYFRPDDKISTVEWIATLRRFQQIAKEDGNHMNLRTGHWATGEIEAAYKAGWLGIYPQGLATFKADTPMPREEVAAVSNRAFNRVMDRDYIRRNDKNMTHYRDVNPSMWSYDDILLASNTFMHDGRFFKAHGITQDNVIFNVNIDGLTITQDLFQRVKR